MSREFEVMEEARNLHQEKYNCEGICPDFIKGVNWADSHPRKGLVDIEKVEEFIKKHAKEYIFSINIMGCDCTGFYSEQFIEALCKAMED